VLPDGAAQRATVRGRGPGTSDPMNDATHILVRSLRATRGPPERLLPAAYACEPIEGAQADPAAGLVEKASALSRNQPGAHVRG
jgi:hypothetical protein